MEGRRDQLLGLPQGQEQPRMDTNVTVTGEAKSQVEAPSDDSPCNLIVKFLPESVQTEEGLQKLFSPFGALAQVKLIVDKNTRRSRGYGFVKFLHDESAQLAVQKMNGATIENRTLRVNIASEGRKQRSAQQQEANLYVAKLPFHYDKDKLSFLFEPYGAVTHCRVLSDKATGSPRGIGFVRFTNYQDAANAIKALNGFVPDGGTDPLTVKFARVKFPHATPNAHMYNYPHQPYPHNQPGGVPPNGYGQRRKPQNGPMAPSPQDVYQHNGMSMYPHPNGAASAPVNSYLSNVFGVFPQALSNGQGNMPEMSAPIQQDSAGLFVFHIPPMLDDAALKQLFGHYGVVLQAKVVRDAATHLSRGYGFVNMANQAQAQMAISALNGYAIGGKHLKVSFKKKKP